MNDTARVTAQLCEVDRAHYLHPFTDHAELYASSGPLIIERAKGSHVWDTDGNRYLDGLAGLCCVNIGYGREELGTAAARQIGELAYFNSFFKCTHRRAIELSERITALAPAGFNRIFYCNSGSESNDTAIRMVRHYWTLMGQPQRQTIIGRWFGYHGSTVAAAAMGGIPPIHEQAGTAPGFAHIQPPYQFGLGRDQTPEAFGITAARWLEEKILELGPDNVAAFIAEPLQGAGGGKMPPATYWPEIQRICTKYGILLVVDEVITGFGRTGAWFGCETYAIRSADLICFAKGVTSGYVPLGGVLVGDRVADTLIERGGEFHHGFTYSGHPVAAAVALANIDIMEREALVARARDDIGPYFGKALQRLAGHRLVGEVRNVALFGAVELVADRNTLEPLTPVGEIGEKLRPHALRHGIIIRPILETVIVSPPLIITHAEVDFLVERFGLALDDYARELGL